MRFSIIVPVFNAENYLNQCIDSVLNQSFADFEVILVNDGSTDGSLHICQSYTEIDDRVVLLNQENGGASSARNNGINNANGEYIIFLDSDDYYNDMNALDELDSNISLHNCDVIIFGCTDFNESQNTYVVSRNNYDMEIISELNRDKTLHYLLLNKLLPGGPTIFCTKKSLINDKSILFKTGIQDEDYDFVLSVFVNASSIYAINNPFYMYRKGLSNSVTGTSSVKMIYGIDYTIKKWSDNACINDNSVIKTDVLNYLAYIYLTGFVISGRMNRRCFNEATDILAFHKSILKYGYWNSIKLLRVFVSLFGVKISCRIFSKVFDILKKHRD